MADATERKSLLERIKKMQKQAAEKNRTVRKAKHKPVSDRMRSGLQSLMRSLKISAVAGVSLTAVATPLQPTTLAANPNQSADMAKVLRQKSIEGMVSQKTQEVQQEILQSVDNLQQEVITAKRTGKRYQKVKSIFDAVYPKGGLSGDFNYCVAGAMYAHQRCNDEILTGILPDAAKTAKEYGFSSHPSVSCPYMRSYFKQTLGENYAEKNDKNFKDVLNNLEAGDIITISSSQNTSTGEHCVTCAGKVEDGKISVKSLNGESDYEVPVSRIRGAACIMKQYREVLTQKLENNIDRYAEQGIRGGATIKLTEIEGAQAVKDTARVSTPTHLNLAMAQQMQQAKSRNG